MTTVLPCGECRGPSARSTRVRGSVKDLSLMLLAALLLGTPAPAASQSDVSASAASRPAAGRALQLAEYARWRLVEEPAVSPDGEWVAWSFAQPRRDPVLHVRHAASGREYRVPGASRAVFSEDAAWAWYLIAPDTQRGAAVSEKERDGPVRSELLSLATGERTGWDDVASLAFSPGATHLAVRRGATSAGATAMGAELVLRDLRNGTERRIEDVAWHTFNPPGSLLAWATGGGPANPATLNVLDLGTGERRLLDRAAAHYTNASWSADGRALAVLRGLDADTLLRRDNELLAFTGLGSAGPLRTAIGAATGGIPAGHAISHSAELVWSAGSDRVFFGIAPQERKQARPAGGQKASDVDVFHWKDDRIQTAQARRAERDRNRTDLAVLHLADRRLLVLSDSTLRDLTIEPGGRWVIGGDERPYLNDWREPRADYYRIDGETGARTPVLRGQLQTYAAYTQLSPDGRYFVYWRDGDFHAYELATGRHLELTAALPIRFADREWDYLSTRPPYGFAGWTADGTGVILDHEYDLWYVPFGGQGARNLTAGVGAARGIRLRIAAARSRYAATDLQIDLARPVLLAATQPVSWKSGFFQLRGGDVRELLLSDHMYSRTQPAAAGGRLLFTRQSWSEFPDLHVADANFATISRITTANPQQAEYAWGRRILIEYAGPAGVPLQATLAIPDAWQPGARLPMIVTFYEKASPYFHLHPVPRYATAPQLADYVSHGYLALDVDVHFRGGSSHSDMLESVEAAVAKVIDLGYAEPGRIGLHGHSYSGGGALYIGGRSTTFAAIVAGAASTNLVTEFNLVWGSTGEPVQRYDIHGQGRYGSNPFEDFDRYWQQSPIAHVHTLNTPVLMMHGVDDPYVHYQLGLEYFNAARFNRKPVIFLSYPGEGHSLRQLENQIDFQARMQQFFDHYLKGQTMPRWMESGERFIDKHRRVPIPVG